MPLFALHVRESRLPLEEVLDGYDALVEQADHVRFTWFPHTSTTLVRWDDRRPLDDGLDLPSRRRHRPDGGPVAGGVFGALMGAARRLPAADRPAAQLAAHIGGRVGAALTGGQPSGDLSYRVFAEGAPAIRYKEVEYAVPRAELAAAMGELAAAVTRSRVRTAFPVEVRCAAADEIPLSPAFGRDTAYIAVRTDRRGVHGDYCGLAEQIMLAAGGPPTGAPCTRWPRRSYATATPASTTSWPSATLSTRPACSPTPTSTASSAAPRPLRPPRRSRLNLTHAKGRPRSP